MRCNRCDCRLTESGRTHCAVCQPIADAQALAYQSGKIAGLREASEIAAGYGPDTNDTGHALARRTVGRIADKLNSLADLRAGNLGFTDVRRDTDGRVGG